MSLTVAKKFRIIIKLYPGVAQLVARMVRVHEAVGSTPATRTSPAILVIAGFSLYFNGFSHFKSSKA